jgi:transcriptional regulator
MYIPPYFREEDIEKLLEFMQARPFATLVSILEGVPFASHVPLVITLQEGVMKLTGHLARANPHWKAFDQGESLAIFTGSHAYISPSLYQEQENVPTWNYIAVHAYGQPSLIALADSPEAMDGMINSMITSYEPSYKEQWNGLSHQFRNSMMNGIIGFEMQVTKLEGKYKLSQNRSHIEQNAVAQALSQHLDPTISGVGEAMSENLAE